LAIRDFLGVHRAGFQIDATFFSGNVLLFADFLHYSNFEAEN
jgi:hypothetical protein